ncbi:MAG: efflux RND transporter periplasmic adaptor subunit [Myxococcales bacterium]|jgi:RND family efflux transporter MFP subunit
MPVSSIDTAPEPSRLRSRLGWAVVALGVAAIGASFAFSSKERAPGGQGGAGPRVIPVAVAEVTRASITERRSYPGELDADAADISAFYPGRLVAVHVRVGDTVRAGQVLAELDPVDAREQIAEAEAQVAARAAEEQRARVEHDLAAEEAARLEPLAAKRLVSDQELAQQRAKVAALAAAADAAAASGAEARARVRLLDKRSVESKVRAPFAGRIADRYVDPGAIVQAGARLVRLVATSPLRVRFQVPEMDIGGLEVSATVRVFAGAAAGHTQGAALESGEGLPAKITGIAGEVSREQRIVTVEALVESPPPSWLPGRYAEVVVVRRELAQATVVPGIAVLTRLQPTGKVESGLFVMVDGVARWVPAVVVARDGDRAAIEAKLPDAARVLVAGHTDLADGAPVRIAESPPGAEAGR